MIVTRGKGHKQNVRIVEIGVHTLCLGLGSYLETIDESWQISSHQDFV